MDPMYWLEDEELLRFFHRHKTEISCMENPHTFLTQLRDHDLVPEDRYKKVSRMKSKDNMKKGIYDILDWLERERAEDIKEFWRSIFKATILNQYPTLQRLRNMLIDGSFNSDTQLPKRAENKESGGGKRKELSEDEEEEEEETHAKSAKKKRNGRSRSMSCDENVQAGPSSQLRPRKKSNKVCFSSPLKKGEENNIWSWPIYKLQLPVTCGHQTGTLDRQRLAKGDKCIVVGNRWFTTNEFERFAGKKRSKNWKLSIRCRNTTLGKLIQEGHLKSVKCRRGYKSAKKALFPSSHVATDDDEDEDEDCDLEEEDQGSSSSKENSTAATDEEEEELTEQQPEADHDSWRKVFRVTCGDVAGTLHKKRFASGTRGKSIRTETSWMTPVEFMQEASCPPGSRWQTDIKCEEEPLSVLLEAKILMIHSLLCKCTLCKPDREDLEDQKNDDECCVCKSEEDELVVCDHCPRSFHQKCHLPHLEDAILGEDRLWMCTFCVFNTTREWLYWQELGRDAAMSHRTINCMLQCQYLLLYLRTADEDQIFATNPCLHLERYSAVITTPMWLQKVADKLQKQLYQTVGDFVDDIQLIFTNCASYNRDNPEFLAMGNRMKELFDQKFKSVFNITETD